MSPTVQQTAEAGILRHTAEWGAGWGSSFQRLLGRLGWRPGWSGMGWKAPWRQEALIQQDLWILQVLETNGKVCVSGTPRSEISWYAESIWSLRSETRLSPPALELSRRYWGSYDVTGASLGANNNVSATALQLKNQSLCDLWLLSWNCFLPPPSSPALPKHPQFLHPACFPLSLHASPLMPGWPFKQLLANMSVHRNSLVNMQAHTQRTRPGPQASALPIGTQVP